MGSRTKKDKSNTKKSDKETPFSKSQQTKVTREIKNLLKKDIAGAAKIEVAETYLNIPTNDHVSFLLASINIIKNFDSTFNRDEKENLYNNSINKTIEITSNSLSYEQKENYKSIFRKTIVSTEGSSD